MYQSFTKGIYETYNLSAKTLQFIGKMISGNMGTDNLSGPIGIAQMAGNTAQGWLSSFYVLNGFIKYKFGVLICCLYLF